MINHPNYRDLKSPITKAQLSPLNPVCKRVQFDAPLTNDDFEQLADFLKQYPDVTLRIYGHYFAPVQNLSFLEFFPFIKNFHFDVFTLLSLDGLEIIAPNLKM
ncbi:MAG: hypothetical protein AB9891_01685 [Anaerolineaceae bacterium]